tara:strand:- start:727 stop:828 length:102 start_codon:yes stop_codon:yes gene_type:complete
MLETEIFSQLDKVLDHAQEHLLYRVILKGHKPV